MKILVAIMLIAVVAWSFFRPSRRGKMTYTPHIRTEEKKDHTNEENKTL